MVATTEHIATDALHSVHLPLTPLELREACVSQKAVGLDFLWKNSGQEWMRSLLASSTIAFHIRLLLFGPQGTQ